MIEINKFFGEIGGAKKEDEDFFLVSHFLCKTYGWDYYTLSQQPIPFVLYLIKASKKEVEEQEKEMKKNQMKKRGLR